MNNSRLGLLFKWYGSKYQTAPKYPKPQHDIIIEPFAGGAGYSLNYPYKNVVLWDEDELVAALWDWLITKATREEIMEIPYDLEVGTDITSLPLTFGQKLLLKHWQRTNNTGDCWTISAWNNNPGMWSKKTRDRVSREVQGIKHWKLEPAAAWIDTPATWFIDPPYEFNFRYYHKLLPMDFKALAKMIGAISNKSLVIACEATGLNGEVPDYLPFVHSHSTVTMNRKNPRLSNELIYIRQPSKGSI